MNFNYANGKKNDAKADHGCDPRAVGLVGGKEIKESMPNGNYENASA